MIRPTPLYVADWRSDFMTVLLERAIADTGGDPANASFIFPHARPEKYLSQLLRQHKSLRKPLLLPQCLTVSALCSVLAARIRSRSAWTAGTLDRVGLLLECARAEAGREGRDAVPLADANRFFPWGLRLAALFEECFSQCRKPDNFLNTGGQVSPFAEMLLARLSALFSRYTAQLEAREWTTPGFDAFLVAEHLEQHAELPQGIIVGSHLYIAGFHTLTGSEERLFRHLWEQRGAVILLHADPALAAPSEVMSGNPAPLPENAPDSAVQQEHATGPHWSCRNFSDWAKRWRTSLELMPESVAPSCAGKDKAPGPDKERMVYYEGFDLHSQLRVLEEELADLAGTGTEAAPEPTAEDEAPFDENAGEKTADTVIVLPDSGLLMPVLHHLPRTDINISMGYPLSRSPLFRLLDTLAGLQEKRRGDSYYWRDLIALVRHPYIKMLQAESEELPLEDAPPETEQESLLRRELYRLERAIHARGRTYAAPRELLHEAYSLLNPDELPPRPTLALLDAVLDTCLDNFALPRSLGDLGQALEALCTLLLKHGGTLWKRFPIDAECLYRIMQSLIPELRLSSFSGEELPPASLFAILRRLMEAERVPFEAVPLVGLQVLGMLETRLLSFRRVIVLDAVDDKLSGPSGGDPLLPEALRPELGLPSLPDRERVAAYHFFRLIAGAQRLVLLWQEGAGGAGIDEGKRKRSRFIEELLWEEEKRLGRLLSPQQRPDGKDGPLRVLTSSVAPMALRTAGVPVSPEIRTLTRQLLERPVSASLLDAYLRCPAQFFYQRLARLAPEEDINEGDDPAAIGELLHQCLQDCYERRGLAAPLPGGQELAGLMGRDLIASFHASPAFTALARSLPADSFAMLCCAGEERLIRYLERQPPTTVLALEKRLTLPFVRHGLRCTLTGKLDRIDLRSFPARLKERSSPDNEPGNDEEEPSGVVILDYKSGTPPSVASGIWEDQEFGRQLARWRPEEEQEGPSVLDELARHLESVQLPFYLLLYSLAAASPERAVPALPPLDAGWVLLGDSGEEKKLFPPSLSPERRAAIINDNIPELIHFLLRHMLECHAYLPRPGKHCDWCSCEKLCKVCSEIII